MNNEKNKRILSFLIILVICTAIGACVTGPKTEREVNDIASIILEHEGITDRASAGRYITVDVEVSGEDTDEFYNLFSQYSDVFVISSFTVDSDDYEGSFVNDCRYYICDKDDAVTAELQKIGYVVLAETSEHTLYENTFSFNLFVVRHGQTEANVAEQVVGQSESPLTDEGNETTILLGEALSGIDFRAAYTSPVGRTQQTAQNVLMGSGNEDVEPTALGLLYDLNFGEAEGMTWDQIHRTYGEDMDFGRIFGTADDAEYTAQVPGAETLYGYVNRVSSGIGQIVTDCAANGWQDENVLLVNHSGFRYWMANVMPNEDIPDGLFNASLTVLHYDRGVWNALIINETDRETLLAADCIR